MIYYYFDSEDMCIPASSFLFSVKEEGSYIGWDIGAQERYESLKKRIESDTNRINRLSQWGDAHILIQKASLGPYPI